MKREIVKRIMKLVAKQGAEKIRVKLDSENAPKTFAFKGSKKKFIPDIVAEFQNREDYFAIEAKPKKEDLPDLKSKWTLFGLIARNKGGNFFLVVNKSHSSKFEEIISEESLSAKLIKV